jgi:membrane-associated phospholipid phosphatase
MQNSFPSGHSITGFSLALLICFWIKNKAFALPCFFLGLSIAYSRMYLFEHFLWDCYTGSIIGVLLTLSAFYFLDKSQWPKSSWADRGIKDYLGKREKSKGSLVR